MFLARGFASFVERVSISTTVSFLNFTSKHPFLRVRLFAQDYWSSLRKLGSVDHRLGHWSSLRQHWSLVISKNMGNAVLELLKFEIMEGYTVGCHYGFVSIPLKCEILGLITFKSASRGPVDRRLIIVL
jgi:hypothetical protein